MLDGTCVSCAEMSGTSKSLTVVIVGLVILVAFALVYWRYPRVRAIVGKLNTRSMVHHRHYLLYFVILIVSVTPALATQITKMKHIFVFFQSVILVSSVCEYCHKNHISTGSFTISASQIQCHIRPSTSSFWTLSRS